MNILIVSFDKSLVKKLRDALKEYNVIDVKNGEEAINTVSSFIDIVIYDAVSGSISEEDINSMYKHKFKDSKYIVLVDDLFPVDMNNIMPPRKIKLMREEAAEKIMDAIMQEPGVAYETQAEEAFNVQAPLEESYTPTIEGLEQLLGDIMEEPASEAIQEESLILDKFPLEEVKGKQETPVPLKGKKLLVVSFDTEIINKVKDALASTVEVVEAKNIREAMEKVKETDIILFDTISGMLAYRTLMDMSKDEELRQKPYVLLIDELFTIDVESIPLPEKYTFAREAELSKAIQKVLEIIESAPVEQTVEVPQETEVIPEDQEAIPELPAPIMQEEEEKDIMSLLEEIVGSGASGVEEEVEEEKTAYPMEEIQEYIPPQEQVKEQEITEPMPLESLADSFAVAIKNVIREQLSQDKLYSIISQAIKYEDLKVHISGLIERKMEDILRAQINKVLSKIDIAQIVREEAYKVLKERLREIIT